MRKTALWSGLAVLVVGGLAALPLAFAGGEKNRQRPDCPGKIVCPLTGGQVCADRCPLGAPTGATASTGANITPGGRQDCPGTIPCPLTGEEVCKDQCPVTAEAEATTAADELPPCCRKAEK